MLAEQRQGRIPAGDDVGLFNPVPTTAAEAPQDKEVREASQERVSEAIVSNMPDGPKKALLKVKLALEEAHQKRIREELILEEIAHMPECPAKEALKANWDGN